MERRKNAAKTPERVLSDEIRGIQVSIHITHQSRFSFDAFCANWTHVCKSNLDAQQSAEAAFPSFMMTPIQFQTNAYCHIHFTFKHPHPNLSYLPITVRPHFSNKIPNSLPKPLRILTHRQMSRLLHHLQLRTLLSK